MAGGQPTVGGTGGGAIAIRTSQPDSLLRHNISDEQLEMLADLKREGLTEAGFAGVGVAGGALVPAADAILTAYVDKPAEALSVVGLINVILFAGGVLVAGFCFIVTKHRGKRAKSLVEQIRNQPAA